MSSGVFQYNSQQIGWLQAVEYHSQNGSSESQQILVELAKNIPSFDAQDGAAQALIGKVQNTAINKAYNPQLSPDSKSLLNRMSRMSIEPGTKPACATRLKFDGTDNY